MGKCYALHRFIMAAAVPISFLIFELPPFSSIQPSRRRM